MKKNIYFVVDSSGSMNEMGKSLLQRNLMRFISELPIIDKEKYSDINFIFWSLNSSITELNIQKNKEFPVIVAENKVDLKLFSDKIKEIINKDKNIYIIFLSDGVFSAASVNEFKNSIKEYSNLVLKTVAIGDDADLLELKKISTNDSVFKSEDITTAIDNLLFNLDCIESCPKSVEEIQFLKTENFDDDNEDNWDA